MTLPTTRPLPTVSGFRRPFAARPAPSPASSVPMVPMAPMESINGPAAIEVLEAPAAMVARARALVADIESSQFDLGCLLKDMLDQGVPQALGYDTTARGWLPVFLEEQLGLKDRKGRYLLAQARYFADKGIDRARVGAIGWAKAKELVGVPDEQLPELVAFAETNNLAALTAKAREAKGRSAGRTKRVQFNLFPDQSELLESALEACKSMSGKDDAGLNLDLIIGEWMSMKGQPIPLASALRLIEANYRIKVTVMEAEDAVPQS